MSKILLTGASGGLGTYLLPQLGDIGHVVGLTRSMVDGESVYAADLTSFETIGPLLDQILPSVIVHAAALTDVDRCQSEPQTAFLTNVGATRAIVEWIRSRSPGTRLVFISTDQVYGDHAGPHAEVRTGPVNIYGWTKLWAEDLVRTLDQSLVLRLNYVGLGTTRRPGLSQWLVGSFRGNKPFTLFRDVLFNPLSGNQAAAVISELVRRKVGGTFNLGAAGVGLSKADFALRLASRLKLPTNYAHLGELADISLRAPRPHDTRMDVRHMASRLSLPDMDAVIESVAVDMKTLENTI